MSAEEISFVLHSVLNRNVFIDLLLGPTFHTKISKLKGIQLPLQNFYGIGALIHQVNLGYNSNRAVSFWINFSSQLQCIRIRKICISGGERQN